MFTQPTAAVLNHLLVQNDRAQAELARFAGKTARFDIGLLSFAYTISEDGLLRNADNTASADAVCVISPALLPRLALHDEKAYADVRTEGDAALLAQIFSLARTLRWDAARDLGRLTGGDIAGRISQTVQGTRQQLHEAAGHLTLTLTEYLTEEHPLLAKPQQVAAFMQQVDALRDDVARLEQRIRQLPAGTE